MHFEDVAFACGKQVKVSGRLDAEAVQKFDEAVGALLRSSQHRLIIDFAGVDYISSAGIRPLLRAYKTVREQERFLEIINTRPEVRKVLTVVGLGELLPLENGRLAILDIFRQESEHNAQALQSAARFLEDLLRQFDVRPLKVRETIEEFFYICKNGLTLSDIETRLKLLLADLKLQEKIAAGLETRAELIAHQIAPFVVAGSILDVGAGDGLVAAAFQGATREIQLLDVVDYHRVALPFKHYDGLNIPFPDKSFDNCFLITVLHHCDDPLKVLQEVIRVGRKRIVIIESVFLNEANRRFNMFFDWFYNCILHDNVQVPFNFNSPEDWENLFRNLGLKPAGNVEIGLDQVTVPEYHWLYALDIG